MGKLSAPFYNRIKNFNTSYFKRMSTGFPTDQGRMAWQTEHWSRSWEGTPDQLNPWALGAQVFIICRGGGGGHSWRDRAHASAINYSHTGTRTQCMCQHWVPITVTPGAPIGIAGGWGWDEVFKEGKGNFIGRTGVPPHRGVDWETEISTFPVADPGFPRGGGANPKGGGGANLLFDQFLSENCMKMKTF